MFVGVRLTLARQPGENGFGGHRRVREIPECGPAERVRASLRDRVHHAAGRASEFNIELIGLHLEFFNRLERRAGLRSRRRCRVVVGVVAAVENKGDLVVALAVDAERIGSFGAWIQLDPRHHRHGQHAGARGDRVDLLRSHVSTDLRGRQIDRRRFLCHGHRFCKPAHLEANFNRLRAPEKQADVLAREFLEA